MCWLRTGESTLTPAMPTVRQSKDRGRSSSPAAAAAAGVRERIEGVYEVSGVIWTANLGGAGLTKSAGMGAEAAEAEAARRAAAARTGGREREKRRKVRSCRPLPFPFSLSLSPSPHMHTPFMAGMVTDQRFCVCWCVRVWGKAEGEL